MYGSYGTLEGDHNQTLTGVLLAFVVVLVTSKVYSTDASEILQASQAASSGSPVVGDQLAQNRAKTYFTTAESRTVAHHRRVEPDGRGWKINRDRQSCGGDRRVRQEGGPR